MDLALTLRDVWRLAEEFDELSRERGELHAATEFVSWLVPALTQDG